MKIRVNGEDFVGYERAQASRHFLDICGNFSFTASPLRLNTQDFPIRVQDSCEILIEDKTFITGFIETIDVTSDAKNVNVTISGRDRTCDLVDSSIDNNFISQFSGKSTLQDICEKALEVLNIPNIDVIDTVKLPTLPQGTYVLPFVGEMAFEFLQRYAKLSQVYLNTDGLGNLLIVRSANANGNGVLLPTILINQFEGKNNNVISAHYHISTVHQYNLYRDYSQLSATNVEGGVESVGGAPVGVAGQVIDPTIRTGRQWVFIDDIPVDAQKAEQRAIWELNYRRGKSQFYEVTVQSHTYDGVNIWQPNVLVEVYDDFAGLNGLILLIDSVTFYESVDEGKTTVLNCVDPLAYTLQTKKDFYQAQADTGSTKYFDNAEIS